MIVNAQRCVLARWQIWGSAASGPRGAGERGEWGELVEGKSEGEEEVGWAGEQGSRRAGEQGGSDEGRTGASVERVKSEGMVGAERGRVWKW